MTENIIKFEEMLREGVVKFTYSKQNGEIRPATGTRCFDEKIVGEDYVAPKGTGVEKSGVVVYWDLDKKGWRSLQNESLISIEKFTHKSKFGVE